MQSAFFTEQFEGLPDPERQAEFYEGLPTKRFIAWLLDVTLVMIAGIPLALIFGLVTLGFGFAAFPLVLAGVGLVYRWTTIAGGSATWGMRFMGIELRQHDGARFDSGSAFLHSAIYVTSMTFFLPQIGSCIAILTTRYRQGLSDIVLRSTAINRPAN